MCKAYRELVKDWKQEERINNLQNLMDSLHLTAEQAMDALKIEGQEREDCYRMLVR